ncbi:MAG: hypothetical protein BWY26_01698 [Elusimicrobia bacterium ADurb.Bin231]|nr:MAG: hypothetical protein BWY26_01698 [Elusimicrobia bacterium ADurb.Bin231]
MEWIWLALLLIFVVIEIATVQIVTIWFAVGALAALITSLITDNILVQVIVMLAASLLSLVCTRPFVKKIMKNNVQPTNADMYIGKEGVTTEEINNLLGTGSAKIKGTDWTARSSQDSVIIPVGARVVVDEISGVKAIVSISEN